MKKNKIQLKILNLTLLLLMSLGAFIQVKADVLPQLVNDPQVVQDNIWINQAKNYINSKQIDLITKNTFLNELENDKTSQMFTNSQVLENWKNSVEQYINNNKTQIENNIKQEQYINSLNISNEEKQKYLNQMYNGLNGTGGQTTNTSPTRTKTMSLNFGGTYRNVTMNFHKKGDIVVNIASSKASGGGNLWSGPHGHIFEGNVNSYSNPVLTAFWMNQTNDIAPVTLSWKEGWSTSNSVIYGKNSIYNYGLGHDGIDIGYWSNRRLSAPEDIWVGEMSLGNNLKQVVFVDPSNENNAHPFYYGVTHATYVRNGGKNYNTHNETYVSRNVSSNQIKIYASCGLSYRTSYISPNTFRATYISVENNKPLILNKNHGCNLVQYVSPKGYILGGYISNSDYTYLKSHSQSSSWNALLNNVKNIRNSSGGHSPYNLSYRGYEYHLNDENVSNQLNTSQQWKNINGKWYFYKNNVLQKNSWISWNRNWYYVKNSGEKVLKWQKISGKWYYFGTDGKETFYWKKISNKWYYFGSNGKETFYWRKISNKWYYFGSDGKETFYWKKINNKWYYFGSDGKETFGWRKINNKWRHFSSRGILI